MVFAGRLPEIPISSTSAHSSGFGTPPPHADYGAWCGFSFPLAGLRYYPFPFFVRGDDVLMPMLNHMRIRTINGVTSLVPRFTRKEGPLQVILSTRALLLISAAILRMNPVKAVAFHAKPFLNELLSYRYGHCLARHAALSMMPALRPHTPRT